MNKNKVTTLKAPREISEDPLSELLRAGAKKLIAEAVEAEIQEFLAQYAEFKNEKGHRQVVRNAYLPEREILTGIGAGGRFASESVAELARNTHRGLNSILFWCRPTCESVKTSRIYCLGSTSRAFPLETSRKHSIRFWELTPKGCLLQRSVAASVSGSKSMKPGTDAA